MLSHFQEDIFKVKAVDLGKLKKLKIWHDNKGGGGAWFLDYVEVRPRGLFSLNSVQYW